MFNRLHCRTMKMYLILGLSNSSQIHRKSRKWNRITVTLILIQSELINHFKIPVTLQLRSNSMNRESRKTTTLQYWPYTTSIELNVLHSIFKWTIEAFYSSLYESRKSTASRTYRPSIRYRTRSLSLSQTMTRFINNNMHHEKSQ